MRYLLIIPVVIAILIGLTFLSSRGGHESYDTQLFKPGPVLGVNKALNETTDPDRAMDIIASRFATLELLSVGEGGYEHAYTADMDGEIVSGTNLVAAIQGSSKSEHMIVISAGLEAEGAGENASGVEAVLAIAERYSRRRVSPKHSLVLVVNGGQGGWWSFFDDPPMEAERLAINLDIGSLPRAGDENLLIDGAVPSQAFYPLLQDGLGEAPYPAEISIARSDQWGRPELTVFTYPAPTADKVDQDTLLKAVDTIMMTLGIVDENLETVLGLPPLPADETP